jgi:hypothetical protein
MWPSAAESVCRWVRKNEASRRAARTRSGSCPCSRPVTTWPRPSDVRGLVDRRVAVGSCGTARTAPHGNEDRSGPSAGRHRGQDEHGRARPRLRWSSARSGPAQVARAASPHGNSHCPRAAPCRVGTSAARPTRRSRAPVPRALRCPVTTPGPFCLDEELALFPVLVSPVLIVNPPLNRGQPEVALRVQKPPNGQAAALAVRRARARCPRWTPRPPDRGRSGRAAAPPA